MANYSSYIAIDASKCSSSLKQNGSDLEHGFWKEKKGPPDSISPNSSNVPLNSVACSNGDWPIHAEDNTGPAGSEGFIKYTTDDGCTITIKFCDSYKNAGNYANITIDKNPGNRYTLGGRYASGDGKSRSFTSVMPDSGSPCYFIFEISTND